MSYECDVCGKRFANASNRLRHKKVAHSYENSNLIGQTTTINRAAIMQDPFTCIVADSRAVRKVVRLYGRKLT